MTPELIVWVLLVVVMLWLVMKLAEKWESKTPFVDARGNKITCTVSREDFAATLVCCFLVGLAVIPLAGIMSHLGSAAVRFTGSSIAHAYYMSKDPVLQSIWEAAVQGNSDTVQQLLRKVDIPADNAHHISRNHLVLDIAGVRASTEEQDAQLAEVLRVLHCMGWNLAVKDSRRQQNALHVLVKQHKQYNILQRVNFIIESEMANPMLNNMLSDEDWAGQSPQQRVASGRWSLVALLRAKRLMIEQAVEYGPLATTGARVTAPLPCQKGEASSHELERPICAATARSA